MKTCNSNFMGENGFCFLYLLQLLHDPLFEFVAKSYQRLHKSYCFWFKSINRVGYLHLTTQQFLVIVIVRNYVRGFGSQDTAVRFHNVISSRFLFCLPLVYSSFSSAFKAPDPVPGPALEKKYPVEMSSLQLLN